MDDARRHVRVQVRRVHGHDQLRPALEADLAQPPGAAPTSTTRRNGGWRGRTMASRSLCTARQTSPASPADGTNVSASGAQPT